MFFQKSLVGTELTKATKDEEYGRYDQLIWAVGRTPNTENLGLEAVGIELDKAGHIKVSFLFLVKKQTNFEVDEYQNTSVDNIYALGDVCGHVLLTPVAIKAGRILAERLYGNMPGLIVVERELVGLGYACVGLFMNRWQDGLQRCSNRCVYSSSDWHRWTIRYRPLFELFESFQWDL